MTVILGILMLLIVGSITFLLIEKYKEEVMSAERFRKVLKNNLRVFIPLMVVGLVLLIPSMIHAADTQTGEAVASSGLKYIGAGISTGLACLGAGLAVAYVGAAGLGVISENDKLFGKTMLYVGLAEGIAIYGVIVSILILVLK